MYKFMDRTAVKALHKRGNSIREIAEVMGCDKDTVKRILDQPAEQRYSRISNGSRVDRYKDLIREWLETGVPVQRMLELVEEDPDVPYRGSRSVFYAQVARLRKSWELEHKQKYVRFEGLPAEYVQIDWGEVRAFPFERQAPSTRYFFAARLKWSRFSYAEFVWDMRLETLIRCMLRAFESFGGVPWIAVFDNMKTVVLRRDEHAKPVWNPTFLKFVAELDFHAEACWPASGNQKGSVESLVGWVKSNFLKGRSFLDDSDLAEQCRTWLDKANSLVSQAHGAIPREVLPKEQARFTRLTETADEYGIFQSVEASHDMLAHVDRNAYMVPSKYVGRPLVARVRKSRIDFYDGQTQVATYRRRLHKDYRPIQNPEYCESVLEDKPRARVMLYRDYLIEQDPSVAAFISELCRRHRGTAAFGPHVLKMYQLWCQHGTEELGVACALASEHGAYGSDYLVCLLRRPNQSLQAEDLPLEGVPVQHEVDRNMAYYEAFAMGGDPTWNASA